MRTLAYILLASAVMWLPAAGQAELQVNFDPQWPPLLDKLAGEGVEKERLEALFAQTSFEPGAMGKKMRALYRIKYMPRKPSPTKPDGKPLTIYDTWLTPEKQQALAEFKKQHEQILAAAEQRYKVDKNVIVAVIMVETKLGTFLGDQTPLATLASMAAATDYEDIAGYLEEYNVTATQRKWLQERQLNKAEWAYQELKALLEYTEANDMDPNAIPCSIYGAIGVCQFMPSNAVRLGADGDGDGKVDLFSPEDAIHSVARFLNNYGWKDSASYSKRLRVVMRYNPDKLYAGTVLAIAKRI